MSESDFRNMTVDSLNKGGYRQNRKPVLMMP